MVISKCHKFASQTWSCSTHVKCADIPRNLVCVLVGHFYTSQITKPVICRRRFESRVCDVLHRSMRYCGPYFLRGWLTWTRTFTSVLDRFQCSGDFAAWGKVLLGVERLVFSSDDTSKRYPSLLWRNDRSIVSTSGLTYTKCEWSIEINLIDIQAVINLRQELVDHQERRTSRQVDSSLLSPFAFSNLPQLYL